MLKSIRRPVQSHGAALLEFQIVALFALLPLLLGILQMVLLLIASHVLHYAVYQAARAGAVAGADPQVMRRALAQGLIPLHAVTSGEISAGNLVGVVATAYARASVATAAFATLDVVSPSAAAFADFAEPTEAGAAIRNDDLMHRSLAPGPRSGQTRLQANLLHLRVRYCQPLLVPLVSQLLVSLLQRLSADAHDQLCLHSGRLPLQAEVTLNMQSDARFHGS
jgi:hypothetical protein